MSNKIRKDFRPNRITTIVFWFVRKSLRVFIILYRLYTRLQKEGDIIGGLQCCSIAVFLNAVMR